MIAALRTPLRSRAARNAASCCGRRHLRTGLRSRRAVDIEHSDKLGPARGAQRRHVMARGRAAADEPDAQDHDTDGSSSSTISVDQPKSCAPIPRPLRDS
jgi:hypothetical protein